MKHENKMVPPAHLGQVERGVGPADEENMKVWTNNKFPGHYPVGTGAVVVAENKQLAAAVLNQKLLARGLPAGATPEQFERLSTTHTLAVVLCDGNY